MNEWDGKERRKTMDEASIDKIVKAIDGPRIVGFKISEIASVGLILLSVYAFYIRTNDTLDRLVKITDYLGIFAKNSDAYHSATTGTQFEQGKPFGESVRKFNEG